MSDIPGDLRYTKEHEYVKPSGKEGVFRVGITDYAQGELGDVVYVELPESGRTLAAMEVFGTVEAVKAVSDLYSPVAGEVVAANPALADNPGLVNSDPYGEGWMIEVRVPDAAALGDLLDAGGYREHIGE